MVEEITYTQNTIRTFKTQDVEGHPMPSPHVFDVNGQLLGLFKGGRINPSLFNDVTLGF
jgi:hypothetical protein